jgi:pimeloyl-ACP methyl ester carboxylesterase
MIENISVDGINVRVGSVGSGPTVVYLHSGSGELGDFPFTAHLAEDGYTVVSPEFPGFGQSEQDPDVESISDAVFRTRRVLDALGIERAAGICGSSLGGWLAAELAVWYPGLSEALVLIDAVGLYVAEAPILDIFFNTPDVVQKAANPAGVDYMTALTDSLGGDFSEPSLVTHFLKSQAAIGRVGWSPYLHDPKLLSRLNGVTVPSLVVWGEDDRVVPVAHGRAYERALVGSRYVEVQGAGHSPALEQPERVASLVADFLANVSSLGTLATPSMRA